MLIGSTISNPWVVGGVVFAVGGFGVGEQATVLVPLGFPLLGFLADAGLFVKAAALQLAKQALTGQLFLGDLQSLLNVVIEDFDFHSSCLCAFPGDDTCVSFLLVPT